MTKLTEEAIRPEALLGRQAELFEADVARLVAKKAQFVAVPCPACGADRSAPLFQKYGVDFQQCEACETQYISPRPTPALLDEFYSTSDHYAYWNEYIFPASEEARREGIFRPRMELLKKLCTKYGSKTDRFVEVGAGFGTFCEELIKANVFRSVLAIEPTPGLAETCRRKGIDVIQKPVEAVELGDVRADFVASFEVIEHLFSPKAYLEIVRDLLNPGGLLLVTCPSCRGFDVSTLGAPSSTYDTEHLNYFHPASLALLAEKCGFEVLEVSTPGKLDADIVHNCVVKGEISFDEQPFLKRVFVEEWDRLGDAFQDFLAENKLSSHMWLVARR